MSMLDRSELSALVDDLEMRCQTDPALVGCGAPGNLELWHELIGAMRDGLRYERLPYAMLGAAQVIRELMMDLVSARTAVGLYQQMALRGHRGALCDCGRLAVVRIGDRWYCGKCALEALP